VPRRTPSQRGFNRAGPIEEKTYVGSGNRKLPILPDIADDDSGPSVLRPSIPIGIRKRIPLRGMRLTEGNRAVLVIDLLGPTS
jgi:hypothetical protein